jgi:hypothetical protein
MLDVAPFFSLDAWYITNAIKVKDKARQAAADEQAKTIKAEEERQAWVENYQQQTAEQNNDDAQEMEPQETPQATEGEGRIPPIRLKPSFNQNNAKQNRKAA